MKTYLNLQNVLDSVATGIFAVDKNFCITLFNKEAEKITGFKPEEALGRKCYEIFRTDLCMKGCYLREAIKTGKTIVKVRNKILNKKNEEVPVSITVSVLRDEEGRIVGGVESFLDDTIRVTLEREINGSHTFENILGKDEKILKLFDVLSTVSRTNIHVLITGETGSGKDIFARAIHNASERRSHPFIKVNCAAIPSHLLESELFGYKKGAFTDAKQDKAGRFQMAEEGTIFLDEIGDLSMDLQAKLLQVLDEKEFYPLGSTKPARVDVRVIASTNRPLEKMVREGSFRQDLYYRLIAFMIEIPPLRERLSDIPLLIDHFIAEQSRLYGKELEGVSPEFMKILLDYTYPGNVRELKHIIEHAVLLYHGGLLDKRVLPSYLLANKGVNSQQESPSFSGTGIKKLFSQMERNEILDALRNHDWNRHETARALKINRTTLWRKMKKHQLRPKELS